MIEYIRIATIRIHHVSNSDFSMLLVFPSLLRVLAKESATFFATFAFFFHVTSRGYTAKHSSLYITTYRPRNRPDSFFFASTLSFFLPPLVTSRRRRRNSKTNSTGREGRKRRRRKGRRKKGREREKEREKFTLSARRLIRARIVYPRRVDITSTRCSAFFPLSPRSNVLLLPCARLFSSL